MGRKKELSTKEEPQMKQQMRVTYKVNGWDQDKHMTEWYFGPEFVRSLVSKAKRIYRKTGMTELKVFQKGTGFLTITIQ